MRLLGFIVAIVLAVLFGHPTLAEERRATSQELRTTVDPIGTWRVMRRDSATSDCIGEPLTPTCAVETWFACFVRRLVQLCFLSDQTSDARIYKLPGPGGDGDIYRIDVIKRVTRLTAMQRKLVERDGDRYPGLTRIGDIDVHVRLDQCAKNPHACDREPLNGFSCLVRRSDLRWKIVGCSGDGVGPDD